MILCTSYCGSGLILQFLGTGTYNIKIYPTLSIYDIDRKGGCIFYATRRTVNYPVSNLIQFRIKWSYRHELHSSCSIKKQIFYMVMKSIFFSSSARSQILKTYLHAKNKSVLRDDLSN